MIAILKLNESVLNDVTILDHAFISYQNVNAGGIYLKDRVDLYYSESELQERIEAAVKEHEQQYEDELKEVGGDYHTSLGKIGFLKRSILLQKENHSDMIQRVEAHNDEWQAENQKLHARIAELEADRQPVEVSQAISKAIEVYKEDPFITWEIGFVTKKHDEYFEPQLSTLENKELYNLSTEDRLLIVKHGYTVKPDPIRQQIGNIIGCAMYDPRIDEILQAVKGEAE